jgi:CO/xanthine dehydrogenase Mo-binding subunit
VKQKAYNGDKYYINQHISDFSVKNMPYKFYVKIPEPEKYVSFADIGEYSLYKENQFQIQAHASHVVEKSPPPFSAHFAEIEIDTLTGEIKVLDYVTATDCGTPINPKLAEGQVEGALVNGLSYALLENYYFNSNGVMLNNTFGKYKIYTLKDLPKITTILVENEYEDSGPFGAKSISEVAINGPIPVIANAFYNATGKRLKKAPFTPEYVLEVLSEQ